MCDTNSSTEAPPDFLPDCIRQRQRQQQQILADAAHNPHNAIPPAEPPPEHAGSSVSGDPGSEQDPHSPVNNAVQTYYDFTGPGYDLNAWKHLISPKVNVEDVTKYITQHNLHCLEAIELANQDQRVRNLRELGKRREGEVEAADAESASITIRIPLTQRYGDFFPPNVIGENQTPKGGTSVTLDDLRKAHPLGLDKLRVCVTEDQYSVSDTSAFSISQADVDFSTGEVSREDFHLFDTDTRVATGQRATLNLTSDEGWDEVQVTVYEPDRMIVTLTPGKILHATNSYVTATAQEASQAVARAERLLMQQGIKADLHSANLSRVDIARTVHLPRKVREYSSVCRRLLDFPRTQFQPYMHGAQWRNNSREISFYDRKMKQEQESSHIGRMEYKLRTKDACQAQLKAETVTHLLMDYGQIHAAYNEALERLFEADLSDEGNQPQTEEAMMTVDNWLKVREQVDPQKRGAVSRMMHAALIARLTDQEVENLIEAEREAKGRQAAYRLRKKVKQFHDAASYVEEESTAKLYNELKAAYIVE